MVGLVLTFPDQLPIAWLSRIPTAGSGARVGADERAAVLGAPGATS